MTMSRNRSPRIAVCMLMQRHNLSCLHLLTIFSALNMGTGLSHAADKRQPARAASPSAQRVRAAARFLS